MTNAINPPYVPRNPLNNNTYGALNPEKITGYITVSSKGTSNGLSDIPNDGALFGPDTLGTETAGIQEAGNYAFTQYKILSSPGNTVAVPAIKILDGYYVLNSPITFDPSGYIPSGMSLNAWVIDYSPNAIVYYNGTGYAITIAGNSSTTDMALFVHGSNGFLGSNATGMYYWVFPGSLIPNSSYAVFHDANNSSSTASTSHYFIYFIGQVSLEVLNNAGGPVIHANMTLSFFADTPLLSYGAIGYFEVSAPYVYIKGAQSVAPTSESPAIAGGTLSLIIEQCTGNISLIGRQTKITGGWQVAINVASNNVTHINTLDIENVTGPTSGAFITTSLPIGTLKCSNVLAGYSGATFLDIATGGSVSNYDIRQGVDEVSGYNFTFASIPVNTPTTPSVPASGTAQENTNPYSIDVYMYGGTVTEIQITRNGTAYTVFSNSTGLALSGQAYRLNPGDSITVTYTTAPDWEWLSD